MVIGLSIRRPRSISAKSFRILEGGVVLGRKVAFLESLHVFLDCGFLSELWASP